MKSSLTIWTATIDGAEKLKRILPALRQLADQLVVGIDDATTDDSAAIARQFADVVIACPHRCFQFDGNPASVNPLEYGISHCKGDWILRVDHDETLGPGWADKERIASLLSDRTVTNYWIARRWAVPPGDRFISSGPWHPDYQVRLFRNIPSLIRFAKRVHEHTTMAGESHWLTREWLVHWDLVWHSRRQREAKVEFCATRSTYTGADYYLYEGRQYETRPLDYAPPEPAPALQEKPLADPLACAIEILEYPYALRPAERSSVWMDIRNLSTRVLHPGSPGIYEPSVRVSYHWYRESEGARAIHTWDHPRCDLPARIPPGGSAAMYLPIQAPQEPGEYWLQADLVQEGVAWASGSMQIPSYGVSVSEQDGAPSPSTRRSQASFQNRKQHLSHSIS
jgi:hypothetical protein